MGRVEGQVEAGQLEDPVRVVSDHHVGWGRCEPVPKAAYLLLVE